MNTLEALEARKSIRGYLDRPVEIDKLQTILKFGNKAPKAGTFHMCVVTNKALLTQINDSILQIMKSSNNDFLKTRSSIPGYQPLYGAPVLIVLTAPKEGFGAVNTACAVTNMCIAATELGLGSCFVAGPTMVMDGKNELSKKVGIPDGNIPQCGLLLGYASDTQIPGTGQAQDDSNIHYVR